jgi:hypothetical protein
MDAEPSLAARGSSVMAAGIERWRWHYDVVGSVLSSYGYSGEAAGEQLFRYWRIQRRCTRSGCRLILTRTVAPSSGVAPISAVLHPTRAGWTAHFSETQGCPGPRSSIRTTEYSSWTLWVTSTGLEATEEGHQPARGHCVAAGNVIHWYAVRLDDTRPTSRSLTSA